MARRIATVGYYVMLPNLYYRTAREFVMAPDKREEMFGHMNALSNAMVCQDIQTLFEHAANDASADDGPAGCVGYCMSGPFAFAAKELRVSVSDSTPDCNERRRWNRSVS